MLAAAVRLCGPLALLRPHVAPFCLDQETDGTIWYRIITLYRVLKMGDGSDRKRHKYKSVGYCGQHRGFTDTQRCTQSWAADISEPWLITVIFTFNDLMIIYDSFEPIFSPCKKAERSTLYSLRGCTI